MAGRLGLEKATTLGRKAIEGRPGKERSKRGKNENLKESGTMETFKRMISEYVVRAVVSDCIIEADEYCVNS